MADAIHRRAARWGAVPLAVAVLLVVPLLLGRADAFTTIECQHPVMTGVEISKLHHVSSATACPVALALFRWESGGNREALLYGCHGMLHPYLRLHRFHGWNLSLDPYFVMSRGGASFVVSGTDFPINCT